MRDLNLPREEVQEDLEKLFLDIYIYDKMTRGNKKQISISSKMNKIGLKSKTIVASNAYDEEGSLKITSFCV